MDLAAFRDNMAASGFMLFENVVSTDLLKALRGDIPLRIAVCAHWQKRNQVGGEMGGAAHHVIGGDDSLSEFLRGLYLDDAIADYFSGPYILNSYGALNNLPNTSAGYAHGQRFHRDVRTYSRDFRLMLNMLVMIDDFTIENGATKIVPGSHKVEARPDDAQLEARSVRLVGKAGSIALFDSNVWHSAAPNTTSGPRMALTLTFTRPFHKQQMDYPALLGENYTHDIKLRQLLGYNSRVPRNYDEWYQPPERRMYKSGQG